MRQGHLCSLPWVPKSHSSAGAQGTVSWEGRDYYFYLDVFWRRDRNCVEMLSRGLKKSSASGPFTSPRDPWNSSTGRCPQGSENSLGQPAPGPGRSTGQPVGLQKPPSAGVKHTHTTKTEQGEAELQLRP